MGAQKSSKESGERARILEQKERELSEQGLRAVSEHQARLEMRLKDFLDEVDPNDEADTAVRRLAELLGHRPSRPRIFVVEDNPDTLELVRSVLEREGFAVEEARNGLEALNKLLADRDRRKPDVMLLDLDMPELGGDGVAAALRTTRMAGVPVVVVSGSVRALLPASEALRDVAVLTKPIDFPELLRVVRERVAESRALGTLGGSS